MASALGKEASNVQVVLQETLRQEQIFVVDDKGIFLETETSVQCPSYNQQQGFTKSPL